ncbi:hypothetical protein IFM12275_03850 [Nocardia sputorum]|nr:hypothetical protein IFM12275_03850 [Nocardia sputorum]
MLIARRVPPCGDATDDGPPHGVRTGLIGLPKARYSAGSGTHGMTRPAPYYDLCRAPMLPDHPAARLLSEV